MTQRVPRLSIIIVTLGGLLLLVKPVRSSLLDILQTPLYLLHECVTMVSLLPRLPALSRENSTLRDELIQTKLEVARVRERLRQTRSVQKLIPEAVATQGVVAKVIGRSPIPTQHTVLLDQGGSSGLVVGSVAVTAEGVIGRVYEHASATALVLLLTDPESRVAALIERSRETGLLVGTGHGRCELIYLNDQADIREGDKVLTSGSGGPFPKGLALGRVVKVVRDQVRGTLKAVVDPAVGLGRLEEVFCVPPAA